MDETIPTIGGHRPPRRARGDGGDANGGEARPGGVRVYDRPEGRSAARRAGPPVAVVVGVVLAVMLVTLLVMLLILRAH